jgi:hypothetical protein
LAENPRNSFGARERAPKTNQFSQERTDEKIRIDTQSERYSALEISEINEDPQCVKRLQHPDTFPEGQSISDSGSDGTGRPELRYVRRKSIRTNSFPPCLT